MTTQKPNIWICPHCKGNLQDGAKDYRCPQGHTYDKARQGYVNLLLAHKKNSKQPGDSASMVTARSLFLNSGYYHFLLETLISFFDQNNFFSGGRRMIDLGCGEGFYIRGLQQQESIMAQYIGIDISKPAIKTAATTSPNTHLAVASCFDIPVPSQSIDVALSVFAPFDTSEVFRILKTGGRLIRVSPGPRHLLQLKQQLYLQATIHAEPTPIQNTTILHQQTVATTTRLCTEDIQNLLGMTPLNWRGHADSKEKLLQTKVLEVDFEFIVQELCFLPV